VTTKTVQVSIRGKSGGCFIPVPFDPKAVFGKVRAPVKVTLNGYTFRSTIARMGGETFIPLRRSNAEAAAVAPGDRLDVEIALDADERVVEVPDDLAAALHAGDSDDDVWRKWRNLSYTNQRECVESVRDAKKPETRARRIAKVVAFVAQRPAPNESRERRG